MYRVRIAYLILGLAVGAPAIAAGQPVAGRQQPAFAGEVVLWDAATGLLKANIEKHAKKVNSVAFSPDGKRLATGSDNGTVKLWDLTGI